MSEKPSRNEEEYFAKREAELLRQQRAAQHEAQAEAQRRSHFMKCPKCGYELITGEWQSIQIDQCTQCHGIWFDAGEAESLVARNEPGVLGRALKSVMRGVTRPKATGA